MIEQELREQIKERGWAEIDCPDCVLYIEPRPPYCDRGRFVVKVDVKAGHGTQLWMDGADGFPRYYFGVNEMLCEIEAWREAKGQ